MWQFWSLSQKIGTPEQAASLDRFLADAPGFQPAEARELAGDRFTAIGQLDVDLEYFIASPTDTPRYTLRRGCISPRWPVPDYREYQDLLNLRLAGDGHYQVVLYPRLRNTPSPAFSSHAGGRVIKIAGQHGTDYVLLADEPTTAVVDRVRFDAAVASVQCREEATVLCLGSAGEVACDSVGLAAGGPAGMHYQTGAETIVHLPDGHGGTRLRLTLPPGYRLVDHETRKGVEIVDAQPDAKGSLVLDVPPQVRRLSLVRP